MKTWTTETRVARAPEHVLEALTEPDDLPKDRDERIAYRGEIASELVEPFESRRESTIVRGDN
jgi:hypothetical protein